MPGDVGKPNAKCRRGRCRAQPRASGPARSRAAPELRGRDESRSPTIPLWREAGCMIQRASRRGQRRSPLVNESRFRPQCPSSPASRRPRPAFCTLAAPARRCSTGSTPSTPAARSCCASKTPIASARARPRSTAILDGLKWLGLNWDGEAISQFQRAPRHREVVEALLASGNAYRCYASQEELEEMRAKARAENKPMRYDGRWRDRDPSEARPNVAPVIRLKPNRPARR